MKISLGKYRANFKYIKDLYDKQKPTEIIPWVSLIAVSNHIPVIVVAWYMGEIIGFTEEINATIEQLKKDYTYESVEE